MTHLGQSGGFSHEDQSEPLAQMESDLMFLTSRSMKRPRKVRRDKRKPQGSTKVTPPESRGSTKVTSLESDLPSALGKDGQQSLADPYRLNEHYQEQDRLVRLRDWVLSSDTDFTGGEPCTFPPIKDRYQSNTQSSSWDLTHKDLVCNSDRSLKGTKDRRSHRQHFSTRKMSSRINDHSGRYGDSEQEPEDMSGSHHIYKEGSSRRASRADMRDLHSPRHNALESEHVKNLRNSGRDWSEEATEKGRLIDEHGRRLSQDSDVSCQNQTNIAVTINSWEDEEKEETGRMSSRRGQATERRPSQVGNSYHGNDQTGNQPPFLEFDSHQDSTQTLLSLSPKSGLLSRRLSIGSSLPSLEGQSEGRRSRSYSKSPARSNEGQMTARDGSYRKAWLEDLTPLANEGTRKDKAHPEAEEVVKSPDDVIGKRGKLVTFYKNGDPFFKGYRTVVGTNYFKSFDTLLDWLNEKVQLQKGSIKHILSLPTGSPVTNLGQFVGGRGYVVSSSRRFIKANYQPGGERRWVARPPSGGKVRSTDTAMMLLSTGKSKPRVLSIISNTSRDSRGKMYLNEKTGERYEDFLKDIQGTLKIDNPPISGLFTLSPRHRKVKSFSHLRQDLKSVSEFIACGQELYPDFSDVKQEPSHQSKRDRNQGHQRRRTTGNDTSAHDSGTSSLSKSPTSEREGQRNFQGQYESFPSTRSSTAQNKEQEKAIVDFKKNYESFTASKTKYRGSSNSPRKQPLGDRASPDDDDDGKRKFRSRKETSPPEETRRGRSRKRSEERPVDKKDYKSEIQASPHQSSESDGSQRDEYEDRKKEDKRKIKTKAMSTPSLLSRSRSRSGDKSPQESRSRTQSFGGMNAYTREKKRKEEKVGRKKVQRKESVDSVMVKIRGEPKEFSVPRFTEVDPEPGLPSKDLELEWIYGYRGRDMVNNLHVLDDGCLIYYVGAIVVILDQTRKAQKFYMEHTEDITCLIMHPFNGNYVATGQLAGREDDGAAHIRVWDVTSEKLETLIVIGKGIMEASVCAIDFTYNENIEDGDLLMAIDDSELHTVFIWKWKIDQLIARTSSTRNTIVWGSFHPSDPTTLATYGGKHLYIWKIIQNKNTCKILRDTKSGVIPESHMPLFVTSLVYTKSGDIITGDSDGHLIHWTRKNPNSPYIINHQSPENFKQGHKHSVFALHMQDDNTLFSAAGNCIKAWNNFHVEKETILPSLKGSVRTLAPLSKRGHEGMLYIGTTGNDILEGAFNSMFDVIVTGHYDELWGLSAAWEDATFVTAGQDYTVIKWDSHRHQPIWIKSVEKPCTSVNVDKEGQNIALGTTEGRLIVLRAHTGNHVTSVQVAEDAINVVSFSPDNNFLALGCRDSSIYIYNVQEEGAIFRKHGFLEVNNGSVIQLDWSQDSQYLRSVAGTNLHFWDVEELTSVDQSHLVDAEWNTFTATIGYSVSGAWTCLDESESINCMDRSEDKDILVVGDDQGTLSVFKYPCLPDTFEPRVHSSNSGHVTNVAFLRGNNHVISTGGIEGAIYQWKLVDAGKRSEFTPT